MGLLLSPPGDWLVQRINCLGDIFGSGKRRAGGRPVEKLPLLPQVPPLAGGGMRGSDRSLGLTLQRVPPSPVLPLPCLSSSSSQGPPAESLRPPGRIHSAHSPLRADPSRPCYFMNSTSLAHSSVWPHSCHCVHAVCPSRLCRAL